MVDNKIDNHGKLEYSKTEHYEGELKDLQRDGFGHYEDDKRKIVYKGYWKDDLFHGKGHLI